MAVHSLLIGSLASVGAPLTGERGERTARCAPAWWPHKDARPASI